jgi:hypothetical protein
MRTAVRRALAGAVVVATLLATVAAGVLTARLYAQSPLDRDAPAVVADALPRLAFLRDALDAGAGERMQELFPEGYFFSHVLYGLTWVEVGTRDPAHRDRALGEARWALDRLGSAAGRAPFAAGLSPPHGVFYVGWSSWLRGGVVRLAGGAGAAPAQADRLRADTDELAAAFTAGLDATGSPFLPAYPGQAWPVDSAVGIAALALADDLGGVAAHQGLVGRWLAAAKPRRDPDTGLLPHRVDPDTGFPVEGARGSSQALLLRFLHEVDPAGAARDWAVFRDRFASTVPGAPGFREHPRGLGGAGDVDSGPLVLGLSASTSVVALGGAVLFGDRAVARALTGLAEATGMAVEYRGQRRYLGGALPVGDAFLAWSLAASGWLVPAGTVAAPAGGPSGWWRVPWHLAILWLLAPGWLVTAAVIRSRRARPSPGRSAARRPDGRYRAAARTG